MDINNREAESKSTKRRELGPIKAFRAKHAFSAVFNED